jgi:2-polyprenyl-3-methyl-5-hydroxy-6-metoxy-1,4-benzoquinol methylase
MTTVTTTERVTDAKGNQFDLRSIRCPTCEVSDTRLVGYRGGKYQRYGEGLVSRIVACRRCDLLYPDPFPFPIDHDKLYADPDKYFGAHNEEAKVESYREIVRKLAAMSGTAKPAILDVGSGRGELLRAAKREGCDDVIGLEFAAAMIAYAKESHGVEMIPLTIEEYSKTAGRTFDAIVLGAVLEHVYDPDAMIASARALLRPGGILYIDVPRDPNILTEAVRLFNRARLSRAVINLSPTFAPYHVFGFTERSLVRLLKKHAFKAEIVLVQSGTHVPHDGRVKDRVKAIVATQLFRLGNLTGRAANLFVWARRA